MEAPEREYRYRLFSTPGVDCGPEVAEFLKEYSGGIIGFERVGTAKAIFHEKPPFNKEAVEILNPDELFGDNFSIVLLNDDLAEPIFWYSQHAVVSRWGLNNGIVEGPNVPIFAYHTILAIVGHELSTPHSPDIAIRAVSDLEPDGWVSVMELGRLPDDLHKALLAVDTQLGFEFRSAVFRVLEAIAIEVGDVLSVSFSEPDPRQKTHEVKADFGMPIEFSGSESAEEPDVQITQYAEHITAWIESYGLPAGVDILPDLQDVLRYTDPKRIEVVVNALNNKLPESGTSLMSLISESDRPSANDLLKTLVAAGHPEVAALATAIRRARNGVIDQPLEKTPSPEPPPPPRDRHHRLFRY